MPDFRVLTDLLVIFSISITIVFVFQKLHLPSIAGFLAAGTLMGPYGLNLVSDIAQVHVLAEIGIVLLLFTIGIEFSATHFTTLRDWLFIAGPIQVTGVILF